MIDDESDYFSTESNRWISDAKREALQQREAELREIRHGFRMNRKLLVELDFAGRRVVEEEQVNGGCPPKCTHAYTHTHNSLYMTIETVITS